LLFGGDPVAEGWVASLNRPGGNITGSTSIGGSLASKRLELLRALVRDNAAMAILVNPDTPLGEAERKDAEVASRAIGQRLDVLTARNEREIVAAFAALKQRRIGALMIAFDTFYFGQMRWMAALADWHAMPTIGPLRDDQIDRSIPDFVNRPQGNFCPHLSTYASSDWTGDADPPAMFIVGSYRPEVDHGHSTSLRHVHS